MNFAHFLEMYARASPEAPALVDRRCRLSFSELDDLAGRFAQYLTDEGLRPGDRIAICLPNRAEAVIAFLGAFKSGVVAVPLNWRLADADLARLVIHCAPGCVLTTTQRAAALARPNIPVLDVGEAVRAGSFWERMLAGKSAGTALPCQNSAIANLLYTSGTTSFPKAAIHTHGMRVSIAAAMADSFRLSSADVALAISPLFHTGGFSVFSNAIFSGCKLVLLENWDVGDFLDAIESERVTFMHLITTIVVDITRADPGLFQRDMRSMRMTWGGGHAVDPEVFRLFERRIGGVFVLGYSRTEGGLTYNLPDPALRKFDANGYANHNSSQIAIYDPDNDTLVPSGTPGEIVVRGDGVSPGYWDGEYVRIRAPIDGGWQRTGDRGILDADGTLHFLWRYDDMIKTGGENVYPSEVEKVLLALPYIKDAVVLGIPDNRLGQRVAAVVVTSDPSILADQIDKACRAALPGFKIPRAVSIVEALPRLGTQKVDIAACRRILESGVKEHGAGAATPASPAQHN